MDHVSAIDAASFVFILSGKQTTAIEEENDNGTACFNTYVLYYVLSYVYMVEQNAMIHLRSLVATE